MNAESPNYLDMDGGWTLMDRGETFVTIMFHAAVDLTVHPVRQG